MVRISSSCAAGVSLENPLIMNYNLCNKGGLTLLNIGLGELLVVLLIAFLVVGPRDLPRVGRWLGKQVRRIRRVNREFREVSGWDDLVAATDDVRSEVKAAAAQADLSGTAEEVSRDLKDQMK